MSLQARKMGTNSENKEVVRGKPPVSSAAGLKRAALGDIQNRVLVRSNSTSIKPNAPFVKPLATAKPFQRSSSVTNSRISLTSNTTKPLFAKPLPRPVVGSKLKRTVGNTSVASIVLPPSRREETVHSASEVGYSKSLDQPEFQVDKDDEDNPLLAAHYAFEIFEYLRSLEDKFPIKEDFLSGQEITARMRSTLVDWLVDVQLQYHLLQETLYLSIQIIDRYMQANPSTTRKYLQLVGVAAMFIACKYEEIHVPELSDFVYITDNSYSKHEVLAMESQMIKALKFELCRPISLTFLRRYSKVVEAMPIHHCYSKYFLELALMEYSFSHINPSLVAAASLLISLCIHKHKGRNGPLHWDAKLEHYSTYKYQEVEKVAQKLAAVILKVPTWKFEAVKKKYSSAKMMCVSLRKELSDPCLQRLADGLSPFVVLV